MTRKVRIFLRTPDLRALLVFSLVVVCGIAIVLVNIIVLVKIRLDGDGSGMAWLLATYGAGPTLVALVLPRTLKRSPDLFVMRNGVVLLPVGLVPATMAIHMPPGPVHRAALGFVWFLLGAVTSLIATPSSCLLRRSAETEDQSAVFTV